MSLMATPETSTPQPKKKRKSITNLCIDMVAYEPQGQAANPELIGQGRNTQELGDGRFSHSSKIIEFERPYIKNNSNANTNANLTDFVRPNELCTGTIVTNSNKIKCWSNIKKVQINKPEIIKLDSEIRKFLNETPTPKVHSKNPLSDEIYTKTSDKYSFKNFENNFSIMNRFEKFKNQLQLLSFNFSNSNDQILNNIVLDLLHRLRELRSTSTPTDSLASLEKQHSFDDLYSEITTFQFGEFCPTLIDFKIKLKQSYCDIEKAGDSIDEIDDQNLEPLTKFLIKNKTFSHDFIIIIDKVAIFCHFLPIILILADAKIHEIFKTQKEEETEAFEKMRQEAPDGGQFFPICNKSPIIFSFGKKINLTDGFVILEMAYKRIKCEDQVLDFLNDERFREIIDFDKLP